VEELGDILPGLIGGAIGGLVGPVWYHHHRIGEELPVRTAAAWQALGVRGRMKLLRRLHRGNPPEDERELPLAVDVVAVQRRAVERRGLTVSNVAAVALFAVAAVVLVAVDRPVFAALSAIAAAAATWSVATTPRTRRRIASAEQRCRELTAGAT